MALCRLRTFFMVRFFTGICLSSNSRFFYKKKQKLNPRILIFAHRIQILPTPLASVDLILQFFRHNFLSIRTIQVGQVDERFSHIFVQVDRICILHELSDHFAMLVLHDKNFFRFCHPRYHCESNSGEERGIENAAIRLKRSGRGLDWC